MMAKKAEAIAIIAVIAIPLVTAETAEDTDKFDQWVQEHLVEVEQTTIYRCENGYLEIEKIYSGKEIETRFNVDSFTQMLKIPIGMAQKEYEGTFVEVKSVLITSATDPPVWWSSYDYPQWAYEYSDGYYIQADPINLAWENTDIQEAKDELLDEGWFDWGTWWNYYVYDPVYGWVDDDNLADDPFGLWGRYHLRLWKMSDGDIVGQAHRDSSVPHHAVKYENAEYAVYSLYGSGWKADSDSYWLGNEYANDYGAYNNGWSTLIYRS
jgi:hypothetical protein